MFFFPFFLLKKKNGSLSLRIFLQGTEGRNTAVSFSCHGRA